MQSNKPKLRAFLWETNFRNRHEGLLAYAKSQKALVGYKLEADDVLCFINKALDRVIMLTGVDEHHKWGVYAYYRHDGPMDKQAIQYIPECFGGGEINYSAALRKSLEERLPDRVLALAKAS